MTYMFGPRFNWRHSKLTPYVQFLFGGAYIWNSPAGVPSITQNAFATAAGGGLDYQVSNHIAIKPIQVEYVMTQINSAEAGPSNKSFGSHQNDVRYSVGVVFRVGAK
jgi:opacity protein-like surface antigen